MFKGAVAEDGKAPVQENPLCQLFDSLRELLEAWRGGDADAIGDVPSVEGIKPMEINLGEKKQHKCAFHEPHDNSQSVNQFTKILLGYLKDLANVNQQYREGRSVLNEAFRFFIQDLHCEGINDFIKIANISLVLLSCSAHPFDWESLANLLGDKHVDNQVREFIQRAVALFNQNPVLFWQYKSKEIRGQLQLDNFFYRKSDGCCQYASLTPSKFGTKVYPQADYYMGMAIALKF